MDVVIKFSRVGLSKFAFEQPPSDDPHARRCWATGRDARNYPIHAAFAFKVFASSPAGCLGIVFSENQSSVGQIAYRSVAF